MILALPIRGQAITSDINSGNWRGCVVQYLGVKPLEAPDGQRLTKASGVVGWLCTNFSNCHPDADYAMVDRYCMVYVLYIFGSIVFPDTTQDMASWI